MYTIWLWEKENRAVISAQTIQEIYWRVHPASKCAGVALTLKAAQHMCDKHGWETVLNHFDYYGFTYGVDE